MTDQLDPNVPAAPQSCPYHNELLNHPTVQLQRSRPSVFYDPERNIWVVPRYEDVVKVLQDYEHFTVRDALSSTMSLTKEARAVLRPIMPICKQALIGLDPPAHKRVRTLVSKAFTPRRVALMEPAIRQIVNQIIDTFIAQGEVDLVEHFVGQVPLEILYAFLGIPEQDRQKVCAWSIDWMTMVTAPLAPERQLECAHSMVEFATYMGKLLEERRSKPQDDFISSLIQAVEQGLAPLSQVELADTIYLLVLVGPETVGFSTVNAVYRLLSDRLLWEQLCRQPELIPQFVEEMLRVDGTSVAAVRITTAEVTIDGVTIPAGATVLAGLSAANHSPEVFADPDRFDMQRANLAEHLSFGQGVHYCLGASLARLELRVILEELTKRMPSLQLVPGQTVEVVPNMMLRTLDRLQVVWDERS